MEFKWYVHVYLKKMPQLDIYNYDLFAVDNYMVATNATQKTQNNLYIAILGMAMIAMIQRFRDAL